MDGGVGGQHWGTFEVTVNAPLGQAANCSFGFACCVSGLGHETLRLGLLGLMPIGRVGRRIGFALLGESLLAVAPKGTKRSCPTIRVSLRSTALVPSPLRGPAYKGHPWPFTPFAASMPLTPLRNDCTRPPEKGDWRCSLVSAMSRSGAVSTGLLDPTLRCWRSSFGFPAP